MTVRDWMFLGLRMNWSIYAEGYEDFVPEDEYPQYQADGSEPAGFQLTNDDLVRREKWYAERGGSDQWWLNKPLDLSTEAPDGTYWVKHNYITRKPDVEPIMSEDHDPEAFPPELPVNLSDLYNKHEVKKFGVVVKDGNFDPVPTAIAVYQCVLRDYMHNDPGKAHGRIDHSYIEGMEWDGEEFTVYLGS